MFTPPPPSRDGRGADCRHVHRASSTFSCKSQPLPNDNSPVIVVQGSHVRIVGGHPAKLDIPRRQLCAWPSNALEYGKRLSRERAWPIEVLDG